MSYLNQYIYNSWNCFRQNCFTIYFFVLFNSGTQLLFLRWPLERVFEWSVYIDTNLSYYPPVHIKTFYFTSLPFSGFKINISRKLLV